MGRLYGGAHEISSIPAPLCIHGWVVGGFMGWGGGQLGSGSVGGVLMRGGGVGGIFVSGWWGGVGWCVCEGWGWWGGSVLSGWWCVGWICISHIWSPTLFCRGILIFQGVLTKFTFLMKFPVLEKINEGPKI